MTEEKKYFSREEIDYSNIPCNDGGRCEYCQNYQIINGVCKILQPSDSHVEKTGCCDKFKPGKVLLYDWRRKMFIIKGDIK